MQRTDSLGKSLILGKIEIKKRRGWQRMRWLDGITYSMDKFEQTSGDGEWQGNLAYCSSWGHKELDMTERLSLTHWVSNVILPSHPLSSPSPLAPNLFQHQSFPVSHLFAWGGQSTGVSALASFLPKKSQGWSPSEWTDWISLQSKGLSRVFSNTTVQKHQFFGAQPSSQSNSHIHS